MLKMGSAINCTRVCACANWLYPVQTHICVKRLQRQMESKNQLINKEQRAGVETGRCVVRTGANDCIRTIYTVYIWFV